VGIDLWSLDLVDDGKFASLACSPGSLHDGFIYLFVLAHEVKRRLTIQ